MSKRNNDNAKKARHHASAAAHEHEEDAKARNGAADRFDPDFTEPAQAGERAGGERAGAARDEARAKSRDR